MIHPFNWFVCVDNGLGCLKPLPGRSRRAFLGLGVAKLSSGSGSLLLSILTVVCRCEVR
jgi:hypothetical protein